MRDGREVMKEGGEAGERREGKKVNEGKREEGKREKKGKEEEKSFN